MDAETKLMLWLANVTGIPLKPYIQRHTDTGEVIVGDKPYAIMGDIRINHQRAMGVDWVTGGFVINGFFHKSERRKAESWAEFMRKRLLNEYIDLGENVAHIKTVRKQTRPDITTQNIMFRVTLTVVFERNN